MPIRKHHRISRSESKIHTDFQTPPILHSVIPSGTPVLAYSYLIPTAIESGPTRCSTRVSLKPISFIQPMQSAPV